MALSKKSKKKIKDKQKIIFKNKGKVHPGEFHKKKSTAENRIVIEETERFLGEGAHGNVYSAKIYEEHGGVVPYAVKVPPSYYSFNERKKIAREWYDRIKEMRELGIKSVVDYAEIVKGKEDRIFLTDLRMYGQVLDFNSKMDLSIIDNFESVLKGISRDMAVIHSNNYILTDDSGTKGFRAWFLLRSKTREGFTGERVICDVGGVYTEPPNFKFSGDTSEENKYKIMNKFVKINVLSLFSIVHFNLDLSLNLCNEYLETCKGKNERIEKIAKGILSDLKRDYRELRSLYLDEVHKGR
jgi:hypothetical protein